MNFGAIFRQTRKVTTDNSPLILTALGVTGTVTTAILAGKASFKAAEVLSERREANEKYLKNEILSPGEFEEASSKKAEFEAIWKFYVPAVGTGLITIACVIGSHHVSTRRAAALASAYTISQGAFQEYKEKVLEKLGEKKEQAVRDEIAQNRVDATPLGKSEIVVMSSEALCFDMYTGRYFKSTMNALEKAMNDTNHQINNDCYASLTDFYDRIGLSKTSESDEIGWNSDKLLDIEYSTAMADDGRPCITIAFKVTPIRNYYRLNGS